MVNKICKIVLAAAFICGSAWGQADKVEDEVGNGGGHLKFIFIQKGKRVLKHVEESRMEWLKKHGIKLEILKQALHTNKIKIINIVDRNLLDSRGSIVDAIAKLGEITLDKLSWEDHFRNGRDVYYLIFHEIMRSSGYDLKDNGYDLSETLHPFPNFNQRAEVEEWDGVNGVRVDSPQFLLGSWVEENERIEPFRWTFSNVGDDFTFTEEVTYQVGREGTEIPYPTVCYFMRTGTIIDFSDGNDDDNPEAHYSYSFQYHVETINLFNSTSNSPLCEGFVEQQRRLIKRGMNFTKYFGVVSDNKIEETSWNGRLNMTFKRER